MMPFLASGHRLG